jgi:hypothetical protein
MRYKQMVFNSFPRSGNVYSSTICSAFFGRTMISTAHMPEIFFVKEIDNVTLFRKPEDVISSAIYQNNPYANTVDPLIIQWNQWAKDAADDYKVYIKYAIENADLIYIGNFDDLINDPINHFKNIAKKFNRTLFPDYEKRFIDAKSKLTGTMWEEEYHGHMPREKSDQRKHIEQVVNSLPFIQELNQEYEEFILKYKTIV